MKTIYIESEIRHHPRVMAILNRMGRRATIIECDTYQQIFNRKQQDFRRQKEEPALILAQKKGRTVLPTPEGFGIGGVNNYYFSTMLNCPFDCRYCYLQGMYQSAHYVLFINYEDFQSQLKETIGQHSEQPVYFFSGYDADSLAYDPVSQFTDYFLPFFQEQPRAMLELRTKSLSIKPLLSMRPTNNVVIAFSLTPSLISQAVEHKVPSVNKRIEAIHALAKQGWCIGLRFDPLIYCSDFEKQYADLFRQIFDALPIQQLHSISIGMMRFPDKMYQKIKRMYPESTLLAHPLHKREQYFSYSKEKEASMMHFIRKELQQYAPEALVFQCS